MDTLPPRAILDKLGWSLVTVHSGASCEVVQGSAETILGLTSTDLASRGLAGFVVGDTPEPCAWQEACNSSVYLVRNSAGQAHWVESRSALWNEGTLLVSTRVVELAPSQERLVVHGRLTLGGSLLGPMAHEVNNLVQGLSAALYFLKDCIAHSDPIEPELIGDMSEVVDDLATLGSSIQNFARQEPAVSEPADLGKIIDAAARFLRSAGKLKTVSLVVEPLENIPRIAWKTAELEYLVLALLCNAADAAVQNVDRQDVRLTVSATSQAVTLEIHDAGGSFRYSRASLPFVTGSPKHRHVGLGLTLVRAMVASKGATMHVEPGEDGKTVRVVFPTTS